MSNRIPQLFSAAVMLTAGAAATASAAVINDGTSAPIAIVSYDVNDSPTSTGRGDDGAPPQYITNGITISFINRAHVPATAITFALNNGTYSQSIVDKGVFSPATRINHRFGIDAGANTFTTAVVNVAQVQFADGSSWHVCNRVATFAR